LLIRVNGDAKKKNTESRLFAFLVCRVVGEAVRSGEKRQGGSVDVRVILRSGWLALRVAVGPRDEILNSGQCGSGEWRWEEGEAGTWKRRLEDKSQLHMNMT